MCGRYRLSRLELLSKAVETLFGVTYEEFSEIRIVPRFNIAPSQMLPIVRTSKDGSAKLEPARWGFVPSWTKGKPKLAPINARCETVPTAGMFRRAFAQRRCLVPADGFYEWKGAKPPKQPFFIHKPDDSIFFFAGLWERWRESENAEPINTFTIITTTPNSVMEKIHNRMPVIVRSADCRKWLDESTSADAVQSMLKPSADSDLEVYPIATSVNNVKNEGPELTKPVGNQKG